MEHIICWEDCREASLFQGEYLEDCPVVLISESAFSDSDKELDATVEIRNLLVMTQSCDLAQNKAKSVALCPIYSLDVFASLNNTYLRRKSWESVRQGRVEGLHMVAGFSSFNNQEALVIDFRQIYSLPIGFLNNFISKSRKRKCLKSPYLEHTAQAFARFFMRVGLPSSIEQFK